MATNLEASEASALARSKAAAAAAAAAAAKKAVPGSFMNTAGYQAGSGSLLDQFNAETATLLAETNADFAQINDLGTQNDALIADLGTVDPVTNVVTSPEIAIADTAEQEGKTAALAAGGDVKIYGANPLAGVTVAGVTVVNPIDAATKDAYALMEAQFSQWGIPEAATFFQQQMQNNIGPNEALVLLRNQPFYQARFAGNTARLAAGMNALKEADYIALENQYSNLFTSYGVQNLATKEQFATLIGSDIAPTELNTRLDLAVTQVQQADPTVMSTLKQFYPNISTSNLVSYFLAPDETLPALQRQVQTADVGAAAIQAGLTTSQSSAAALAAYGVTYSQAQAGYGKIAEVLPASQKLSAIYGAQTGINYNQAEGEAQYLENSGAAALEQQKLKDLEGAQFSGKSGIVGASAAAGYSGSLGQQLQGKI